MQEKVKDDTVSRQAAINAVKRLMGDSELSRTVQTGLHILPSAQPDNQTNLCDSCDYSYPDCPSKNDDVIFGNGIGNDNICACNKYKPSAQPEPIRINLNEPIKVKLTDWGKEIYYHQYDRTNQIAGREICKPKFPKEDENGYTKFQLWYFIQLYGEHIGMALPNVIEPLEIVYER